jgi:HemY protein
MLRLVLFLIAITAVAVGLSWLADRPGSLVVNWQGYEIETSVFRAIVLLAMLLGLMMVLWSVLRQIWHSPATIGHFFNRRRQKRGLEALSSGMIAIGAGDRALATRYAIQARKSLPNEPLTQLLRAQAAQLSGDRATSRRIFEAMLGAPDTEQLGMRGLFLEAEREGEREAARQFAERAMALNPQLGWPAEALFDIQCQEADWDGALQTLTVARRHNQIDRAVADRRRAVLLTAQAQAMEQSNPDRAMTLALEAHGLATDLVPAAAIAGRALAAKGNTSRAAKVLQRTWKRSPHPDLATAYAYARIGDSPKDRLDRVIYLAGLRPHSAESAIALATAAIEAHAWDAARAALKPLIADAPTQRACTLMARIEAEQHGDKGRVREWLARAVSAPRDPAWTADGVVSDHWAPVSPVTGALDAFQWRVPVEALEATDGIALSQKIEELVQLGAGPEVAIEASVRSDPQPPVAASKAAPQAADAEIIDVVPPPQPAKKPVEEKADEPAKAAPSPTRAEQPTPSAPSEPPKAVAPPQSSDKTSEHVPEPAVAKQPMAAVAVSPVAAQPIKKPFRTTEPRVFTPPRAPDDPGPETLDSVEDDPRRGVAFQFPVKGSA